jgi:hypothetical protein
MGWQICNISKDVVIEPSTMMIVADLDGMMQCKDPETFGHASICEDGSSHLDDVFPVGFSKTVLRLSAIGSRMESDISFQEDLPSRSCNEFDVEIALDSSRDASCFHEECEEGVMDVCASYTFEPVYVFMSRLVINDEDRLLETTGRIGVSISNIHTHFSPGSGSGGQEFYLCYSVQLSLDPLESGGLPCDMIGIQVSHLRIAV